ncbi:hypothetical protein Tco_0018986 [Tanacetum coccineum]
MVVQDQEEMGEGSAVPTDPHHTPTIIQPSPQPQKKQKPRKPKRKDTQIPQSSGPTEHVADEAVYKELDDILDLEKTKTTQAEEIVSLKRRVKKLEQKKRSRTYGLKRLYKVGLTARVESSRDEESLGEDASKQGDKSEPEVAVKDVNLTVDEVTLAQALAALKRKELSLLTRKKPKDFKEKSFDSIQKMFDKAFKRVNTFVDFRTDLVEGSSKRVGTELEQEIKELMEIVPDKDEVAIDAIPLAVKPPSIIGSKQLISHTNTRTRSKKAQESFVLVNAQDTTRQIELNMDIVGIKRLLDDLRVTAAQVCVTAAKLNAASVKISTAGED